MHVSRFKLTRSDIDHEPLFLVIKIDENGISIRTKGTLMGCDRPVSGLTMIVAMVAHVTTTCQS